MAHHERPRGWAAAYAQNVMERADVLGNISEEPDRLTRRVATPAMKQANSIVEEWMRAAGMSVRQDNIGNLVGRYEGTGEGMLVLGSHLDSVRDAGKYDGPLGVLVAISCVQALHDAGKRLPHAIEVAAFADEEGLRYHTSYLGSRVFAGSFDPSYLDLTDAEGISLAEAIREFGGDPGALDGDRRDPTDLLGYCEVHIEQGPVLEAEGLPVGVVSAIAAQTRFNVAFRGVAGHAGTVPMHLRHDALCAAAEFVLAVEEVARSEPGAVGTVGQMAVQPGASNVIPGSVTLSLDVRHQDNATLQATVETLWERAEQISKSRGVVLEWELVQSNNSVPCSPDLSRRLADAVELSGYPARYLPSGAGHDGVIMSQITPIAMLFVRCKGGISHNPAESVEVNDVQVAIEVMSRFLELVSAS
ncbi:MAG: allantoate amidohydrolase [Chloroflexota bacterium]|nr:allantoate amidohydrolase [Chloroflexota bacterium]MDQ5865120.1 allantoate amidohydrolase [Chloroflexota bacterium]